MCLLRISYMNLARYPHDQCRPEETICSEYYAFIFLFQKSFHYRAATFASQNDVKWCHRNFRGARDTEISMVGAKLFGVAHLFALVSTRIV